MDHRQERRRHTDHSFDELEDELDYNIKRKEELKREIRNLEDKNKELQNTHWKNVMTQMDIEKENSDLKERIKLLEKENRELNNRTNIEDSKLRNIKLEETIKLPKDKNFKTVSNLEAENQSLKLQVQNILTCDDCKQRYDSKTEMTNHFRAKHLEKKYKCDECYEYFEDFSNMGLHRQKNH